MSWVTAASIINLLQSLRKWGFHDGSSKYKIFIILRIYDIE